MERQKYMKKKKKKIRHKYLDKADVSYDWYTDPKRLNKKRVRKYGFDTHAETYELMGTSINWLYEHMRAYLHVAGKIVDLDYKDSLFKADIFDEEEADIDALMGKYSGYILKQFNNLLIENGKAMRYPLCGDTIVKELTQKEMIEYIINDLELYYKYISYDDGASLEDITEGKTLLPNSIREEFAFEHAQHAFYMYSIVLPAMWW